MKWDCSWDVIDVLWVDEARLEAGATPILPLLDRPWGDRLALGVAQPVINL